MAPASPRRRRAPRPPPHRPARRALASSSGRTQTAPTSPPTRPRCRALPSARALRRGRRRRDHLGSPTARAAHVARRGAHRRRAPPARTTPEELGQGVLQVQVHHRHGLEGAQLLHERLGESGDRFMQRVREGHGCRRRAVLVHRRRAVHRVALLTQRQVSALHSVPEQWPVLQPPSVAHRSLQPYSQTLFALQAHSPGHLMGALRSCRQSQSVAQGPAVNVCPHAASDSSKHAQRTRDTLRTPRAARGRGPPSAPVET
jgi:hypothetical protein